MRWKLKEFKKIDDDDTQKGGLLDLMRKIRKQPPMLHLNKGEWDPIPEFILTL